MRFHNITMKGNFKAQTVVDASALVWVWSDERRMLYDQTTKAIWIADDTEWKGVGIGVDIPATSQMWIYAASAPDGWTINGTPSDQLLAVKGGSTYVTGGTAAGNFTMPNHQHYLLNHTHTASGTTTAVGGGVHKGDNSIPLASPSHVHSWTATLYTPNPGYTDNSGGVPGYRPESHVGIICSKN